MNILGEVKTGGKLVVRINRFTVGSGEYFEAGDVSSFWWLK
jgi:hypothetical protein